MRSQELSSFLAIETKEELVVDRSAHGDLLRINFNISFSSLSCEFATLDVSDALGTVSGTSTVGLIMDACVHPAHELRVSPLLFS